MVTAIAARNAVRVCELVNRLAEISAALKPLEKEQKELKAAIIEAYGDSTETVECEGTYHKAVILPPSTRETWDGEWLLEHLKPQQMRWAKKTVEVGPQVRLYDLNAGE